MDRKQRFVPRYPLLIRVSLVGLPVLFIALIFGGLTLGDFMPGYLWWPVIAIGLAAAILPYFFVRRIEFREPLIIRRYLLPSIYIDVQDVGAIENGILTTKRGTLRLGRPLNLAELEQLLQRWKADHTLRYAATGKWPIGTILIRSGYGTYGFAWAMLLGVLVLLVIPAGALDARWIFGGVFLGVYLLLAWALPNLV